MRASDLPAGWRRATQSENLRSGHTRRAERYVAPNGDNVSRRTAENVVARGAGWDSWSEYQRVAQSRTYRKQLGIAVEGKGLPDRPSSYRREAGPTTDYSQAYARFRQEGDIEGQWSETHSRSPQSPWAQMQVAQGIRDQDARYDIGDTPGGKK